MGSHAYFLRWDVMPSERVQQELFCALPESWRQRTDRKQDPVGKVQSLLAYSVLRVGLCRQGYRYLPVLTTDSDGKPYFLKTDLHFSISHTEGAVLVLLSGRPVGTDVERLREVPAKLCRRLGIPEENFWQEWTRREAVGKLRGTGVAQVLKPQTLQPGEQLCQLYTAGDFVAAAAGRELQPLRREELSLFSLLTPQKEERT